MKRIHFDSVLREKLGDLSEDVELFDERGYVIAHIQRSTPWNDPDNWIELTPDITDEEWERIRNADDPGITTQDLIDHLKRQQ